MQVARRYSLTQTRFPALLMPVVALALLATGCASNPPSHGGLVEVHGVIRDRDGAGVEGLDVGFDSADGHWHYWRTQRTDRNGTFRMFVRAGTYRPVLSARHVRVPTVFLNTIVIALPSTELNYRYGGVRIGGRLMGPGGKPVESGTIKALGYGPGNESDAESQLFKSHYTLFVPPGAYMFVTRPGPTYLPSIDRFAIGPRIVSDTTIDFPADGNLITGRVLLGSRAVPRKAEIQAWSTTKDIEVSAYDKINADGRYRLYLPDGNYTFSLRHAPATRFVCLRSLSYEVNAPATINLNFSSGEWTGTVRDSMSRAPVQSVQVMATDTRLGGGEAISETDRRGRFRLVLDPGSNYTLSLRANHGNNLLRLIPGAFSGRDSTFDVLVRTTSP